VVKETSKAVMADAFDRWWEWANKPVGSYVTIPADIHNAVMELSLEERLDRVKVNEAVRRYREVRNRPA
jgi:hypothetical protein